MNNMYSKLMTSAKSLIEVITDPNHPSKFPINVLALFYIMKENVCEINECNDPGAEILT